MRTPALSLILLAALAGCGGGDEPAATASPAAGGFDIKVDGVAYAATLTPTATGTSLKVTRPGAPMTYDEGALAKQVAGQFCSGRGKRLAPWSLGQFAGDGWTFDGGCA